MLFWTVPFLLHPQMDYFLRNDLDRVSEPAFLVIEIAEIILRHFGAGEINRVAFPSVAVSVK